MQLVFFFILGNCSKKLFGKRTYEHFGNIMALYLILIILLIKKKSYKLYSIRIFWLWKKMENNYEVNPAWLTICWPPPTQKWPYWNETSETLCWNFWKKIGFLWFLYFKIWSILYSKFLENWTKFIIYDQIIEFCSDFARD